MPQSQRSNEFGEVVSWFVSKFGAFVSNEMMRNIIGQTKSSFNLRDVMDNKKILLVNLSKGRTGELNSKLLGMIFVMKFQAAAMSRANIPESQRVDFSLYVDEFQNFSTDSFATIMSEARKYHLNLIVANQFTTQLTEEIRDAVFGNMGTIVAFRVGQNDVDSLTRYFQPTFDADDLLRVPNYNTITRTLTGGVPTQPFSMSTLPPLGDPNPKLSAALKQLSAAKFGQPKAQVEKEIFARIATKEAAPTPGAGGFGAPAPGQRPFGSAQPPQPGGAGAWPASAAGPAGSPASPFGQQQRPAAPAPGGYGPPAQPGQAYGTPPAGVAPAPAPRPGSGSFLDEWLAKRGTANGAPGGAPAPAIPSSSVPAYGTPQNLQTPQNQQNQPPATDSSQSFQPQQPQVAAQPAWQSAPPQPQTQSQPSQPPQSQTAPDQASAPNSEGQPDPVSGQNQSNQPAQTSQQDQQSQQPSAYPMNSGQNTDGQTRRKKKRRKSNSQNPQSPQNSQNSQSSNDGSDQDNGNKGNDDTTAMEPVPTPNEDHPTSPVEDHFTHGDTVYINRDGDVEVTK
jgi:hypothetical protein